jgi:hypothetical protein
LAIEDLKALLALVPWDKFAPKNYALINPVFDSKKTWVHSADGDLIIDDTLIDIKTVQKMPYRVWEQLIGYYLLTKNNGILNKNMEKSITISKVASYFSRHGIFQEEAIPNIIRYKTHEKKLWDVFSGKIKIKRPQRYGWF